MSREKEKMLTGKPYQASDELIFTERQRARDLTFQINSLHPRNIDQRNQLFRALLGHAGNHFHIESPFYCDYGYNISVGENFYANYHCTILDCAPVTIGDNVFFGPNISLYAAGHPIHHDPRNAAFEYAFPITIGHSVWMGGGCIVNPGITIGDNCVIGAGSVVTRDIPSNVIAVGNPCRVLRPVTDEDRQFYFKKLKF
ncbi:sugar O-acetyltransferase [Niabella insulamsoli]|uniref:sugar O-acetyltransferase n=1 Tax=Niabella insulamsoli TaxID=3144874 RepID=UPI0031FC88BE